MPEQFFPIPPTGRPCRCLQHITALAILCATSLLQPGCTDDKKLQFTPVEPGRSGIDFSNTLREDETANVMNYLYFYNGSGVAAGDIDNDGYVDLLFTGNMVPNRLYRNKGNFEFEDITEQSGIAEQQGWCTGATMVDINQDGLLDIYICRSGDILPQRRQNLLYINDGNGRFSEQAQQYGLADAGYSTQAAFFDYDRDGDLDMFLINHSQQQYAYGAFEKPGLRRQRNPHFASKLYRNDGQHFTDVSAAAGIVSNVLSFGLGLAITDYNRDNWPDVYVSNDFNEPDYLYRNNGDGTFSESLAEAMDQVSLFSMGCDAADINNDAFPDLVTLDMLPEDNYLQKMHSGAENFNKFQQLFRAGFYFQYSRNMLQRNNGDGSFSEVAQWAGVSNTDWSWSALLADFDNDGRKDLFITNGYARDYTDMDFMKYRVAQMEKEKGGQPTAVVADLMKEMPTVNLPNYAFQQDSTGHFENRAVSWGLGKPGVSSGATYADLDNDGDLDLVVSNTNAPAGVYRNNNETLHPGNRSLQIRLIGAPGNVQAIGASVTAYCGSERYFVELQPVRGYQSAVDPLLHLGLGGRAQVDSLEVRWPNGDLTMQYRVPVGKVLELSWKPGLTPRQPTAPPQHYLVDTPSIAYTHYEQPFNDFTLQGLLPEYQSRFGPCMASADVNGDGRHDLFIGGGGGRPAQLFLQQSDGSWRASEQPAFAEHARQTAVAAVFFDANGDGSPDLYVASGGYALPPGDLQLNDRLYLNNGRGQFRAMPLPPATFPKGAVAAADIDGDGDIDLFVGGRVEPGRFPLAPPSLLLLNDGRGIFRADEKAKAALSGLGMVTSAVFTDLNGDRRPDLVVAGAWMPVTVLINRKEGWGDSSKAYIRFPASGNWNHILLADLDQDGDDDLVLGNMGLNGQWKASPQQPLSLWYKDFDRNGSIDPLIGYPVQGKQWPLFSRDDLVEQLPVLNKRYLNYSAYASVDMPQLLSALDTNGVAVRQIDQLETLWLENRGKEGLVKRELPAEAQWAPVYGMAAADINGDGHTDLVLAGNNAWARIKLGRFRANHGLLLLADGKGGFVSAPATSSGLHLRGDCRSLLPLYGPQGLHLFFGMNDAPLVTYQAPHGSVPSSSGAGATAPSAPRGHHPGRTKPGKAASHRAARS